MIVFEGGRGEAGQAVSQLRDADAAVMSLSLHFAP